MAQTKPKSSPDDNKSSVNANHNKRKRKEIAPFGNYRHYYGYRVGHDAEEDPRFKVLDKEWFEGKDCLDIGCNSGLITINIAKKFHCRSILGIDIDNDRVIDAWFRLRKIAREEKTGEKGNMIASSKVDNSLTELEGAETCSSPKNNDTGTFSEEQSLLDIVAFRCDNFVTSWRPLPLEHFDTIICLSVTKWVHLNWGDEGLILLFAKFWRLLRPVVCLKLRESFRGGILVLEPQPWESYYKNRLTTETTQVNYNNIRYRPEDFQEMLLDKIGFRTVELATSRVSGVGFDRPVLVFCK